MAIYQWKGIQGKQMGSGEIEAANSNEATEKLKQQSIIVTNLFLVQGTEIAPSKDKKKKAVTGVTSTPQKRRRTRKVKIRELMIFTKKFATMSEAGLSILKILKMLEDQMTNPYLKQVVRDIYVSVESGSTLSDAFAKHPAVFDTVYTNLLRAGEMSGKLTLFLRKLVIQIEKTEKIRSKVKGALMYPIILMCVAVAVILIMLIKVVPIFQNMFASMGHSLPAPTQFIVTVSEFFRDPGRGGVFIAASILSIVTMRLVVKNNRIAHYKFDRLMLKIPLLGEIFEKSILAKIAMLEGNLGAAGVPVLDAFDIIARTIKNMVYKEAIGEVKDGVSTGKKLSVLFEESIVFPVTFSQLVAVGEETGNMDEMFDAAARYYEEEFDMTVERLTELLEPLMIVFIGATIGFIIVAMYMPIFQIGQTIQ